MDRDRQTATLNYEMSNIWETKPCTILRQSTVSETRTGHEV